MATGACGGVCHGREHGKTGGRKKTRHLFSRSIPGVFPSVERKLVVEGRGGLAPSRFGLRPSTTRRRRYARERAAKLGCSAPPLGAEGVRERLPIRLVRDFRLKQVLKPVPDACLDSND